MIGCFINIFTKKYHYYYFDLERNRVCEVPKNWFTFSCPPVRTSHEEIDCGLVAQADIYSNHTMPGLTKYRKKCQCCQRFFSFYAETKEPVKSRFGFKVYKWHDGKPAGFHGVLREGRNGRGRSSSRVSKMYYSTDREGYIHSHPTVEIDDEYWRLLEIRTHRLWRQKMIRERETVLCPPEGVKAMMWQGKAADVSIKNYPNVVHTSKHEAYGNYCYYCFHRSGSLAWAIWESRMCQASSSWDEERIAAKVIKEWWKKIYWSPDT